MNIEGNKINHNNVLNAASAPKVDNNEHK